VGAVVLDYDSPQPVDLGEEFPRLVVGTILAEYKAFS
jgi:hypothetical protein